jgi:hypothetical protein
MVIREDENNVRLVGCGKGSRPCAKEKREQETLKKETKLLHKTTAYIVPSEEAT